MSSDAKTVRGLEWGQHHFKFDYDYVPRNRRFENTAPGRQIATYIMRHIGTIEDWSLQIAETLPKYAQISPTPANDVAPFWANGWLPAADAVMIYGSVAKRRPRHYIEIGSGNSTKFARRAIQDFNLDTRIISIDPLPRAEVDKICDRVIRSPVEEANLVELIAEIDPGDVVFIDSSHRSFQNSDVTVCLLELIPQIPSGVLYGVHDICLPFDYDPCFINYYYNEQYLLAAYLLGGGGGDRVAMPIYFAAHNKKLEPNLAQLYTPAIPRETWGGSSFWLFKA